MRSNKSFLAHLTLEGETSLPYITSSNRFGWWPFDSNANEESGNIFNRSVPVVRLQTDLFTSNNSSYAITVGITKEIVDDLPVSTSLSAFTNDSRKDLADHTCIKYYISKTH